MLVLVRIFDQQPYRLTQPTRLKFFAPRTCIASAPADNDFGRNQRRQDSLASVEGRFLTRGRPLGRRVDCKPKCFAVDSTHSGSPNGRPRFTQSRTIASSFSVCD